MKRRCTSSSLYIDSLLIALPASRRRYPPWRVAEVVKICAGWPPHRRMPPTVRRVLPPIRRKLHANYRLLPWHSAATPPFRPAWHQQRLTEPQRALRDLPGSRFYHENSCGVWAIIPRANAGARRVPSALKSRRFPPPLVSASTVPVQARTDRRSRCRNDHWVAPFPPQRARLDTLRSLSFVWTSRRCQSGRGAR